MTYVSKKEKVFALPEQEEASSTSLSASETRLKRFPSVSDRRAWASEEGQRYQHLYGLVNGSESSVSKSSSFKYIPFDVLLAILMAEKDAYIQELLDRQEDSKSSCGGKANVLFKAEGFEDSDDDREALIRKDAEVVSLKNRIAGLESELEDYRETLTKAMHKLENMDAVMSENNLLREKIACSEETIKCLEQRKAELEKELEYPRKKYFVDQSRHHWDGGDCDEVVRLSSERDILLQQVMELQKELERAKTDAAEVEVLRKMSQTTSSSLEEVSRENECYRKKLEGMKCLEKHIEELKKQAATLTDKYKRESQKANDHLKQISVNAKELQVLREERDRLQRRVNELVAYESQYFSLEGKLHQVEVIIDENEMLNKKMIQLNRLELENEELKMKLEELKCAEIQAVEDKERILQLQAALTDQDEEIRKMLKQIEELTHGYTDKNEIHRLRVELEEKNGKLMKYERQLADIPVLESEIDELKNKLQKCIEDFGTDKDLLGRLQEELEACRKRCRELEEMAPLCSAPGKSGAERETTPSRAEFGQSFGTAPEVDEKAENTTEAPVQDAEAQSTVLELQEKATEASLTDMDLAKLEELEKQNENLKTEVSDLRLRLSRIDLDELLLQTNELKVALGAKGKRIAELEAEVARLRQELQIQEELKLDLVYLGEEARALQDRSAALEQELDWYRGELRQARDGLLAETKSREFALTALGLAEERLRAEQEKRKLEEVRTKLSKEEANLAKQDIYLELSKEIDRLKASGHLSGTLIRELKKENALLRELKDFSDNTESAEQKSLIKRLRAEVDVLKNLSRPQLEGECETLKEEVRKLLRETDALLGEITDLKSDLDSERVTKDQLENEVTSLKAELSACVAAGDPELLGKELAEKESLLRSLREELDAVRRDLQAAAEDARRLREENVKLSNSYNSLKSQQKDMESEISWLLCRAEDLNEKVRVQDEREKRHADEGARLQEAQDEVAALRETARELRDQVARFQDARGETAALGEKVTELERLLKAKEEEVEEAKKSSSETTTELNKLHSEMDVLRNRLAEKDSGCASEVDYERELEEKYALEEALRKIENELDELKIKLEECRAMEEEMSSLKSKRDSLLEKMSEFESEIDTLKKKLSNFESLKDELDQLKAEKSSGEADSEVRKELREEKARAESLHLEKEILREELSKAEALLDVYKKLQGVVPQVLPPTQEFFTPQALPSPDSSHSDTISLEKHKKEIMDLENRYRLKVENLKETNADKVKKLVENHEKEAKCRTKAFHDSVNHIRSCYESDIRKLVEKHKRSIMRLQGLHEDQVQELNTNHETQMEAMQTQHENVINDLRTESAERSKHLREQHNRELRELELKYEAVIREKEAELLTDKSTLQSTTSQATNLEEIHKQTVDALNQYYQTAIAELEEKHGKELKKCKKSNLKRIELMKNKYEALLVEERKKYEEQLEDLLLQLEKGRQGEGSEVERHRFVQKRTSAPASPCLEFLEILQKIINEGLDSLTFEELVVVHSKTCFMPESPEEEGGGGGEVPPSIGSGCRHRGLMAAEKEELLKRIFNLEHEIVIKQLETHEAIVNMETAERYRLQELKNALCTAQQKNEELKRLLSSQSKLQMDLKIDRYMLDKQASLHETSVMEKVKELEREKAERRRLEEELQRERATLKHLTSSLESEKERFKVQRKRDAEYVDSIRRRLEEALHHEQMMESQLEYEARLRTKLEAELQGSQKGFGHADANSAQPPGDSKAAKDIRNLDQCETKKELRGRESRSKSKHRSKSKALRN